MTRSAKVKQYHKKNEKKKKKHEPMVETDRVGDGKGGKGGNGRR